MRVKLYVQHWYGGKVYHASTVKLETYNTSQTLTGICIGITNTVVLYALRHHMDGNQTHSINEHYDRIGIVFVVLSLCVSKILIVRIIGELYAQVNSFPITGPETG